MVCGGEGLFLGMLNRYPLISLFVLGIFTATCQSDPADSGSGNGGASSSVGGSAGAPPAGGTENGGASAGGSGGSGGSSAGGSGGSGGSSASGGSSNSGGSSASGGSGGVGAGGEGNQGAGGSEAVGGSGGAPNDDEVSLEVTPDEGGTLTLDGTTIEVPPGAVAETVEITIKYVDPSSVEELPSGFDALGPMIALLPHGLTFDVPVSVTLEVDSAPAESVRSVFRLDDEQDTSWETLGDVSFEATSASFETTTFSVMVPGAFTTELVYSAGGTVKIGDMALVGNRLVYTLSGPSAVEVRAVNTDGTNPANLATIDEPAVAIQGLTTTRTAVYFVVRNILYSVPIAGGALQTLTTVGTSTYTGRGGVPTLVTDGTALYYAYRQFFGDGGLQSFDLSGTPLASLPDISPTTLVLDGDTLLSTELQLGGIQRIAKTLDSATATTVMLNDELPGFGANNIVHDSPSIYVLAGAGGNTPRMGLWRKPRSGSAPQQLLTHSLDGIGCGLVLAEPFLYFIEIPNEPEPNAPRDIAVLGRIDKNATRGVPTGIAYANSANVLYDTNFIYFSSGIEIRRLRR